MRVIPDAIDVSRARAATQGATDRHYFNAAGSALMSDAVVGRVVAHLERERMIGGYEAATAAMAESDAAYAAAAELIGARPDEIAMFDSATSGLRTVFDALRLTPEHTVVSSRSTYVSQALRQLSQRDHDGVGLAVVENDETGAIDLAALERKVAEHGERAVISVAHVPTSSGLVEPVVEIGKIAQEYGARYVLDATQSVGQIEVNVRDLGCDALVTTGRKFLRGPRRTGFAYVSSALQRTVSAWAPDVRGSHWDTAEGWTEQETARKLETWEYDVAARLGLGVALRELLDLGLPAVAVHLSAFGALLREELAKIDGIAIADPPAATSAIVTLTVAGLTPSDFVAGMRAFGVDTTTVPAHHAQWDLGMRGIESVVRIAPHVYNDESDLEALLRAAAAVVSGRTA